MKERRRSPRYPVEDVNGVLVFVIDARILNMSVSGMAVETATNLRVGRSYTIKLTRDAAASVQLSGSVMWCHLRGVRTNDAGQRVPVYEAGIEFGGVLSETAGELLRFLRDTAVIPLGSRVFGRFRLELGQPVNLATDYEFMVKTISASGMLIETVLSPRLDSVFDMEVHVDGASFRARGRVAYVRELADSERRGVWQVGVEFAGMTQRDRALLEEFIEDKLQPTTLPV